MKREIDSAIAEIEAIIRKAAINGVETGTYKIEGGFIKIQVSSWEYPLIRDLGMCLNTLREGLKNYENNT